MALMFCNPREPTRGILHGLLDQFLGFDDDNLQLEIHVRKNLGWMPEVFRRRLLGFNFRRMKELINKFSI
jgi:hypothetical protein